MIFCSVCGPSTLNADGECWPRCRLFHRRNGLAARTDNLDPVVVTQAFGQRRSRKKCLALH
jgi:hypothetical protein